MTEHVLCSFLAMKENCKFSKKASGQVSYTCAVITCQKTGYTFGVDSESYHWSHKWRWSRSKLFSCPSESFLLVLKERMCQPSRPSSWQSLSLIPLLSLHSLLVLPSDSFFVSSLGVVRFVLANSDTVQLRAITCSSCLSVIHHLFQRSRLTTFAIFTSDGVHAKVRPNFPSSHINSHIAMLIYLLPFH